MANTNPTIINTYFYYWREFINPIEEEKRSAHFADLILDVGLNLYGVDFALELAFLILKHLNPEVGAENVTDSPLIK